MLPSLVVGCVTLAAPQGAWFELLAKAQLDVSTLSSSAAPRVRPPDGSSLGGQGAFGITVFGRRVVDEDSAPALGPFLQRVAAFHVEASGGGASSTFPIRILDPYRPSGQLLLYEMSERRFGAATTADGYVGRWLYLGALVSVEFLRWDAIAALPPSLRRREIRMRAALAMGARWRDLLLSAGWSVAPYRNDTDSPGDNASTHVRFWGGAFVSVRAVVHKFVDLSLRMDVIDAGATVDAAATFWVRRRIGVAVGVEGGHGSFVDSAEVFDRAGGYLSISYWFSRHVAASLAYTPSWQRAMPVGFGIVDRDISSVAHFVTLSVVSRPPIISVEQRPPK
jgi:hypothetical protein